MFSILIKYLILIVVTTCCCLLNETNASSCQLGCPHGSSKGGGGKYKFEPGKIYRYDLSSVMNIFLTGTDNKEIKLEIHGRADLYVENKCTYGLKINNLQITEPDGKQNSNFGELNADKMTKFIMSENDIISPEICANPDDTEFGLNIKRAIISLIQSAPQTANDETDIFGICPTTISERQTGQQREIVKIRNLNQCSHRENLVTGLIAFGAFNEHSSVKSTPLLNGDYRAEQFINNNILDRVVLNEDYSFAPYISGIGQTGGAIKSNVVTKLKLKDQQPIGKVQNLGSGSYSTTIKFQNPNEIPLKKISNDALKTLFQNTIQQFNKNIGENAAEKFTELIDFFKLAKKDDLLSLFSDSNSHANKELAKSIYLDALFRTGTSESIIALFEIIDKLNDREKQLAYISFNTATSVNKNVLSAINKYLIANPKLQKEAYLSIGTLIKLHCRTNNCDGQEVQNILNNITNRLGANCSQAKRELNTIGILKGLRNTQQPLSSLDRVIECATTEKQTIRVKVAALQTLATIASSCNSKVKKISYDILNNNKLDSELRIEAYLTLVGCPTEDTANKINDILDKEIVNQVGSFIQSHLKNLRATTDSSRENGRKMFSTIKLTNKFPIDIRQYSFNHDLSYGADSVGIGGGLDTTVIYSEKSYLPRSVKFNMTATLFGNSFNFLEIGGRQENLDKLIETYFGPKGFFNTVAMDEIMEIINNESDNRKRRSVASVRKDIEYISKLLAANNKQNNDIELDLTVKLFGSEMFFLSLGEQITLNPKTFIKKFTSQVNILIGNGKKFNELYERRTLFLDTEFVYPIGVGFPLKLRANGAGGIRLETSGSIDLKEIKTNPKSMAFKFGLVPSFNLQLAGSLIIDGFAVNAGLKVSGTIHSSTGGDIDFKLNNNGKGFDTKFTLLPKQEIVNFDHQLVFITQERGHPLITNGLQTKTDSNKYCFDQFQKIFGVTFCYVTLRSQSSALAFPLNGPNHISAYIETESEFNLIGKYDDTDSTHPIYEINFKTPKSSDTRDAKLIFDAMIKDPNYYLAARLESANFKASTKLGFKNDDKEKILYGKGNWNEQKYDGRLGFESVSPNKYKPIVSFTTPTKKPNDKSDSLNGYQMNGFIEYIQNGNDKPVEVKFDNIHIVNVDKKKDKGPIITLNGKIGYNRKDRVNFNLDVNTKDDSKTKLIGSVEYRPKYANIDLGITNNKFAFVNGKVHFLLDYDDKQVTNDIVLIYGKDFNSKTNRVEYHGKYTYEKDNSHLKQLTFDNKFNAGGLPLEFELNGAYNFNKLLKYNLILQLKNYRLTSNVNGKVNTLQNGDYDINGDIVYNNKHKLDLILKRQIKNDISTVQNRITASCGLIFELNGSFANKYLLSDTTIGSGHSENGNIDLNLKFKPTNELDEYSGKFLLKRTNELFDLDGKFNVNGDNKISLHLIRSFGDKKGSGSITIFIKDLLNGNGKMELNNGVGKSEMLIDFIDSNRKVKLISDFTILRPKYNFKYTLFYDFDKDNSKVIDLKSNNQYQKESGKIVFTSDNELKIHSADTFKFAIDLKQNDNDKNDLKMNLILPTERTISLEVHDTKLATDKKLTIKLIDTLNREKQQRSFEYECHDSNIEKNYFDSLHKFEYINFNNKKGYLTILLNHKPKGHFDSISSVITLDGNIFDEKSEIIMGIDEYCEEHAVYNFKLQTGEKIYAKLNGKLYFTTKKPLSYEMKYFFSIPNTSFDNFDFQSNGKIDSDWIKTGSDIGDFNTEFKTSFSFNNKATAIEFLTKSSTKLSSIFLIINVPDSDPISVKGTFKRDPSTIKSIIDDTQIVPQTITNTFELNYAKSRTVIANIEYKTDKNEFNLNANIKTTLDSVKLINLSYKYLQLKDQVYSYQIDAEADGKKSTMKTLINISNKNPSIDILITYPQIKDIKVQGQINQLHGDDDYNGHFNLINFGDFNFISTFEVSLKSLETFKIIIDVNSPKLKLNNIHLDVQPKQGSPSSHKGLQFKLLSEKTNIISGTADYSLNTNSTYIEAHGDIKIYDVEKSANFKLIRNTSNSDLLSLALIANIEKSDKINAILILGPKNFQVSINMCAENNKCYKFEIKSNVYIDASNRLDHQLFVLIDLRELGFDNEFHLRSNTTLELNKLTDFVHDFEMRLKSKSNIEYTSKCYVDNKKLLIEFVLPKRTMSIEGIHSYQENPFKYVAQVNCFIDKINNPNNNLLVGISGEIDKKHHATGELKFKLPTMKLMRISGNINNILPLEENNFELNANLNLDIFKKQSQAIDLSAKFVNAQKPLDYKDFNVTFTIDCKNREFDLYYGVHGHAGFSKKKLSGDLTIGFPTIADSSTFDVFLYVDENGAEFIVTDFKNRHLIEFNGEYSSTATTLTTKLLPPISSAEPLIGEFKATDSYRQWSTSLSAKNIINANGKFVMGETLNININGPQNEEVFNSKIVLDPKNFVAPQYKLNENNFKNVVKSSTDQLKRVTDKVKEELKNYFDGVSDKVKKQGQLLEIALPEVKDIKSQWKNEMDKLGKELLKDKALKEVYEYLNGFYVTISKTVEDILKVFEEHYNKIRKLIVDFYEMSVKNFNEKIKPSLVSTYEGINNFSISIFEETKSLLMAALEQCIKYLKNFEDDFAKVTKLFFEYYTNIAKTIDKYYDYLRQEVNAIYKDFKNNVDALNLPAGYDEFKQWIVELFANWQIFNVILNAFKEINGYLKAIHPNREFSTFVDNFEAYVENKLENKPVNDVEQLKSLVKQLIAAIESSYRQFKDSIKEWDITAYTNNLPDSTSKLFSFTPVSIFSFDTIKNLPYISNIKLSPWNYIINEQFPSIQQLIYSYRPHGFNPINLLPPFDKYGQISDGRHIFSFDGKHLTLPSGQCQYILAQDSVNTNFSIIANLLADGKLNSIIVMDKDLDTIELNHNGILKLNDKLTEMPVHKNNLHIWRGYYQITILSEYGALIECTLDLRTCTIRINGFYHNKLRGLLGNGNSELYDDFILPNGKITDNLIDFTKGYRVQSSKECTINNDIHEHHHQQQQQHHHHGGGDSKISDECNLHFNKKSSSLSNCFYFIKPDNYREACEHAVEDAKTKQERDEVACNIAKSYALLCRLENIPINLSPSCGLCLNDKKIGDQYSVQIAQQQKKCDIVIVTDTEAGTLLTDFVQPFIGKLKSDLNERNIRDTNIIVIGYNENKKYYSHFTSNGKLNVDPEVTKISNLDGPKTGKLFNSKYSMANDFINRINNYTKLIKEEFHQSPDGKAFQEALQYPFRSSACKAIIAIRSDGLTGNPIKHLGAVLVNELVKNAGISLHMIGPIEDVVSPPGVKNVIGFSNKLVISMDQKRKPHSAATEQRSQLMYKPNIGIEMVQDANGFVFNSNVLKTFIEKEKVKFVNVASSAITDQLARTDVTSKCECKYRYGVFPIESCEAIETKIRPPVQEQKQEVKEEMEKMLM